MSEARDLLKDLSSKLGSHSVALAINAVLRETEPAAVHWSDWFDWPGGPQPLPDGMEVCLVHRDGRSQDGALVGNLWWDHRGAVGDIVHFRYRCDEPGGWIDEVHDFDRPHLASHYYERRWTGDRYQFRLLPRAAKPEPLPERIECSTDEGASFTEAYSVDGMILERDAIARIADLDRILRERGE